MFSASLTPKIGSNPLTNKMRVEIELKRSKNIATFNTKYYFRNFKM